MIDPHTLRRAFQSGFSPLPGRCLIELDTVPTMVGTLHVPESAQELRLINSVQAGSVYGDTSWTGRVLAMTPRKNDRTGHTVTEDFRTGDRVCFLLLNEDMDQKLIMSRVERMLAVIG